MGKKIFLIMLLAILIIGILIIYPILFQEGNPIPIIKGIIGLSSSNNDIVKISDEPKRYITKIIKDNTPIIELMDNEGWKFDDQAGSGYIFSKDDNIIVVSSVQYTKNYRIWKIPNIGHWKIFRKHVIK